MKQSKLFTKTTKNISEDVKVTSHKLLHRGGFIRESVAGRYYFLPLGMRVRDKVAKIIEEEMDKTGALKIITPVLHPLELWKETNRTESVGFELMTIKDRSGSRFALGGTAEEMMVDLVRGFTVSYRDLPFNIYQFSQKFRDEKRARGGLLRVREFLMKDGYSFHVDEDDFKKEYQVMWETYLRIFERLGLKAVVVESDNGYIGGDYCHEFVVESEIGESKFLVTEDETYAAHEDVAKFQKDEMNPDEELKDMTEVDAVRGNTMEDGVSLHQLPLWQQLKDVMFVDEKGKMILAIIRGDLNVNETKLMHLTKSHELRHATDEEIRSLGSEPGFISPVGLRGKVLIVADDSLRKVRNMYGGANVKNSDRLNVNIERDYQADIEGDIALAEEGFKNESGKILKASRGIEVGNIFQLGYHYSEKMKAKYMDVDGQEKLYYMGCYGIGVDRTLATVVEKYNDERGIVWPEAVAPFKVHLIKLKAKNAESGIDELADKLYADLNANGVETLYDDRDLSPGEKFADSDLIGIPYRVVVSERSLLAGGAEVKKRSEAQSEIIKVEELVRRFS